MNNTKRKMCTGVIAAVVCFAMILTSFGALIGAALGMLSNEDLINAINNGSISVGDLALLASLKAGELKIDGQVVTNIAKDGYQKKGNSSEIGDKTTDYDTYNKPYYTAGVTSTSTSATIGGINYTVKYAPESSYFGGQGLADALEKTGVPKETNLLIYCDISMRHGESADKSGESVIVVKENANLVIAMATPEEILAGATNAQIQLNSAVFKDGLLGGKTVYGICLNRCYFDLKAGASLTLLGRDFNGNGYIDDKPVEITVNNAKYLFYEKIVLSGSSAYQDYDPVVGKTLNGGKEVFDNKDGITRPLISVYGGTATGTSAKLIISGADLRNNFNEKVPTIPSSATPGTVDDVVTGGGAIYLASGSASGAGRNSTTGGWFKEVIITNTRFAYCGAVRGGAIMVGKNFYSSTLDLSYCDYDHCYTAYYNYKGKDENLGANGRSEQSGDGGAVCFYQDETTTEDWYATKNHNNPSLIYAGTVDFTGSTFSFCYAMRAGGAIHFGGYHYNESDLVENSSTKFVTNASGFTDRPDMLGTRIGTLKIDFCDFYCCGAGWAMKGDPGIEDSDFIFRASAGVSDIPDTSMFYGLEGVTDYVTAPKPGVENLFSEVDPYGTKFSSWADLQWLRHYDDPLADSVRDAHNWYNIPQMKFAKPCREGGAIFFNCRVGEMSMSDCTFIYCAADSNGGAVFLDDRFVCPSATVENCLFKNNICNETARSEGATDTGTFRSTGLAAADIHFNNCSFLYNLNFGGGGALYLNLNNTYTSSHEDNAMYNVAKPENDATTQRNKDRCAGSEVNNCLFFGNFASWSGAAIRCTGVMDINSSTFAHNISNNGYAGAIYFLTYERTLVDVATEKAQMRFDIKYGDDDFDGHTIVCYNEVGGGVDKSGGGGIAISATHSPSVGKEGTTITSTGSGTTITSREYSFDFALNGVLVFNNTASGGGGGIYFRVNNDAAPNDTVANAWVYDKNVDLNNGYVFNNYAYGVGGGVRVRDDCSVREGATNVTISGANVYDNESNGNGGGLYILAEGGIVNIEGGCVVDNKAHNGAGIYIKDTNAVNITGGNVGISKYGAPTLTRGDTDTTFATATSATLAGGNVASTNGGGIFIENAFTDETYFDNDTTVTMTGGIIEANKATSYGGGLYMKRGTTAGFGYVNFTMVSSSGDSAYGFYGNTATSGAGIYADSGNTNTTADKKQSEAQRYVVNLNGGEVTANVANKYGGGAYITAGAKLVVNGGIMDSNKANTYNGGAVYINNELSEAVISDGQISNNYAKEYGGGIQAYDADVTVNGGTITGNESGIAGGGLAIRNTASLTMNTSETGGSGIVFENESVNGGAVFVSGATAVATIKGGAIGAGNTATNGGGIYANDSATVTMDGGNIDGNTAANNGGGIYVENSATVTMTRGNVDGNTAANEGGGIYVFQATANINGGTISRNTAATSGGGACVRGGATLTMSDGSIVGNTATSGSGGGIFVTPSDGTVQNLPSDRDTTLKVAVWTRNKGASSPYVSEASANNIINNFKAYLETLGYTMSALDIELYICNQAIIADAVDEIFKKYPTDLDAIIGGGNNIYSTISAAGSKYTNLPTTGDVGSNAAYNINSDYVTGSSYRNIAYLDKNQGVLAKLFYKYVLATNPIVDYDGAKAAGLLPQTVSTIIGGSSATISGGNVSNNSANVNGGGICVTGDSTFVMNGGNVTANTAKTGNGGGIYTDATASGSNGLPKDGITTLNVHVWQKVTSNNYVIDHANLKKDFIAFLDGLGYDTPKLKIEFLEKDGGGADTACTDDLLSKLNAGTKIDAVIGGGLNVYESKLRVSKFTNKGYTFDVWYENDSSKAYYAGNYARLSSSYVSSNSTSRTIALLTQGGSAHTTNFNKVSDLAELFYRFALGSDMPDNWNKETTQDEKDALMPQVITSTSVTLTAGNIAGNSALNGNGGGVCCDNGSAVKLNASADNKSYPVIDSNSAKNGGGIAVINGGDVTMQGGYVTNNKAIGTSTGKTTDGYITNYLQFTGNGGVGGGIYVANPYGNTKGEAKFTIENYKNINSGIYHNNAEFAADDLYANAVNTLISVPAFGDMKIKDDAGNVTGWYEDYATNEPRYTVGLNGNKQDKSKYPIERYDKSESNKVFKAWVSKADKDADQEETISSPDRYINGENFANKYGFVCVTLGAYVVYDGNMTITKDINGTVDPEQVFIFHVQRTHDQYGNPTADGDVNLFVTINGEGFVTIHSLPLGTYEVTELTDWSWRYKVQSTSVKVANESGNYVAGTDDNDAADIVKVDLKPADDKGACNNPKLTFVNVIEHNEWIDGNSPKVVNTAGATTATSTTVGGQNTGKNVAKTVVYANFKREETLI